MAGRPTKRLWRGSLISFGLLLALAGCAPAPRVTWPGLYRSHSDVLDERLRLNRDGTYQQILIYQNGATYVTSGTWEALGGPLGLSLTVHDGWNAHREAADVDCDGQFPPVQEDKSYAPTYFVTGLELEDCPDADAVHNLSKGW